MRLRYLLAVLPLLAPPPAAAAGSGELPAGLSFGGPFELVDHRNRVRRDTDFRGRFLLVFFGYTGCPDVCPLDLAVMAKALDLLGEAAGRIQPLFVTVDPARDTPEVLADFVSAFHPRLLGLTGSEAQIRAIAKAYRVHRRKVIVDPEQPEDYLVDHGSLTYLMGPDGGFRTFLPHKTTARRMAEVVRRYLDREPPATGRSPPPR